MSAAKTKTVLQLKITLRDIDPPVWRRVQVPGDMKLHRLHDLLQLLFNWEDYHLHEFVLGKLRYGVPDPDAERGLRDEYNVPVQRLVARVGAEFEYVYDFGDEWRHHVLLEGILLPESGAFYPRCIGGERNGPPEDAGGPFQYTDYIRRGRTSRSDEDREIQDWFGSFDPDRFPLEEINARVQRAFQPRRRATAALPG